MHQEDCLDTTNSEIKWRRPLTKKRQNFNRYFISVFSKCEKVTTTYTNKSLNKLTCSEKRIGDILFDLNPDKSTGPDRIGNLILKKCHKTLCKPMKLLFQACINRQWFPTYWKISQVTPIFKEGSKADVTYYGPISLLCCSSKVFEKLIFDKIYYFFERKLHPSQYGFRKRRSATLQLITFLDQFFEYNDLEKTRELRVLYLDFAKQSLRHCFACRLT